MKAATAKGGSTNVGLSWIGPFSTRRAAGSRAIQGSSPGPCGGNQVRNIGEIGAIRVLKIKNEGKHNKRVEIALVD